MSVALEIKNSLVPAMKEKEKGKITVIRNLITTMEKTVIQEGLGSLENLTDLQVQRIVLKEIDAVNMEKSSILDVINSPNTTAENKQRYEDRLTFLDVQLTTLDLYAPKYMSEDELTTFITKKAQELNIELPQGKGKFIGMLSKELTGKADMKLVSKIVSNLK